jgi:hypothetical protein
MFGGVNSVLNYFARFILSNTCKRRRLNIFARKFNKCTLHPHPIYCKFIYIPVNRYYCNYQSQSIALQCFNKLKFFYNQTNCCHHEKVYQPTGFPVYLPHYQYDNIFIRSSCSSLRVAALRFAVRPATHSPLNYY